MVRRPAGTDRRILNDDELARAGWTAEGQSSTSPRQPDGRTCGRPRSLVDENAARSDSAHFAARGGAGLLWNLFLPEGAALDELLNLANANQYYANHCRWARRRYGKWQNTDAARARTRSPLA